MSAQSGGNRPFVKIPLRIMLTVPFVTQIVVIVGLVGYLSFRNGQQAVNTVAHQLRSEITARIEEHLRTFLNTPHQINQINANIIRQRLLDANDVRAIQHYFWEQIQGVNSVTSGYFGNPEGGMVGAGREGAGGALYVTGTDKFRSGTFYKYATDREGNRTDLLAAVPNFDARQRPWYTGAIEKDDATWSKVYILSTGQDMAIAASRPVYDAQHNLLGVVSMDIFLAHLGDFLKHLKISASGRSFIIERSGLLIASSTAEQPFTAPDRDGVRKRLQASESENPLIRAAAEFLSRRFGDYQRITSEQHLEFESAQQRQFLQVTPIQDPYGLDWLVVVVIPESDFMTQINANNRTTAWLIVAALAIAIGIGIITAQRVSEPIARLNVSTHALAEGEWEQIVSVNRISEINELSESFNRMARQLKQLLVNLTSEIADRKRTEENLRRMNERFALATRAAHLGVWDWDIQKNELLWDDQMYRLYGITREDFAGAYEAWLSGLHPDDVARSNMESELARRGEKAYDTEFRVVWPDGTIRYLQAYGEVVRASDGTPLRMTGVNYDITDRKRAEEALRESEECLQLAMKATNDVVWDWDITHDSQRWNEAGIPVFGWADIVAQPQTAAWWVERVHPDDRQRVADKFHAAVADPAQSRWQDEYRFRKANGSYALVLDRGYIKRNEQGQAVRMIGAMLDITDRKQAEERIRFQAHLLDSVQQAVIATDPAGAIIYMNTSAEILYGWSTKDAIGRNIMDVNVPQTTMAQAQEIMTALANGASWQGEFLGQRKDGSTFPADVTDSPVYNAKGELVAIIGVSSDITQRKQAEEQIKTALAEKETLLRELYHRTKNNMQVISSMLALQAMYSKNEEVVRVLCDAENRIQTMSLVHQKLYQAQNLSRINLQEYIRDLTQLLMQSYKVSSGRIALVLDVENVSVLIDTAIPCGLILNELMSNALKHAFPGERAGEIRIKLDKTEAGAIELHFADNGVGVPEGFDFCAQPTLGLQTIFAIGEQQMKGNVNFETHKGVACHLSFNDTLYKPRV